MLNTGGLLIIASPYTWNHEHTDLTKWLGRLKKVGEDLFTRDGLHAQLQPELILLEELRSLEVRFVIPDADGTFQYTYSSCTVFGSPDKLK